VGATLKSEPERRDTWNPGDPDRRCTDAGRRASDALPKVPCPECGCSISLIVWSRPALSREGVRRRRECVDCHHRFSTLEVLDRAK